MNKFILIILLFCSALFAQDKVKYPQSFTPQAQKALEDSGKAWSRQVLTDSGFVSGAQLRSDINDSLRNASKIYIGASKQYEQLSVDGGIRLSANRQPTFITTHICDDGNVSDYNIIYPIFHRNGVSGASAIVPAWILSGSTFYDDAMTTAQMLEMQATGWEFMSHTMNHVLLNSVSDDSIETELDSSITMLESWGLTIKNFVAPGGSSTNAHIRNILRKYFRSNYMTNDAYSGLNYQPIHTYSIRRVNFQFGTNLGKSLSYYKNLVDSAKADNAWLVFTHHPIPANYTAAIQDTLDSLLAYTLDQGGQILTPTQALDLYGNLIDIGDGDDSLSFQVGGNGKIMNMQIDNPNTKVGLLSGRDYSTASGQTVFGFEAGRDATGTNHQVAIGKNAGDTNSGRQQNVFGELAGFNNSGQDQTAVGREAGRDNTGRNTVFVGLGSGNDNTGADATSIGYTALGSNTGARAQAFGYQSGYQNSGANLVALGYQAGYQNSEANLFVVANRNASASNPLIKGYFGTGGIVLGAPAEADTVARSLMGASRLTFFVDEGTDTLYVRVKYSNGTTVKKGAIPLR